MSAPIKCRFENCDEEAKYAACLRLWLPHRAGTACTMFTEFVVCGPHGIGITIKDFTTPQIWKEVILPGFRQAHGGKSPDLKLAEAFIMALDDPKYLKFLELGGKR